jgi:arylsulfatase A-like enzyme
VKRHRDGPFFLYYPVLLTHGAYFGQPVTLTPENKANPPATNQEAYAGMVRYMDRLVGEFVAALDRLGVRDNTLVVIATDNGTEESFTARRNGRQVKGGLYHITENGGNVAFLVNSPKLVPGGRVGSLTDFTDVFPTLCDFAGAPLPRGVTLDGHSYKSYLQGKGDVPRKWIFNEYRPDRVVRDTRYKLWDNGKFYDLERDPDEQRPLEPGSDPAADRVRAELQAVLKAMPPDTPLPFPHRSLSAFRQRAAAAKK